MLQTPARAWECPQGLDCPDLGILNQSGGEIHTLEQGEEIFLTFWGCFM